MLYTNPIVPCPVDLMDSMLSERLRFIKAAETGIEVTLLTRTEIRKLLKKKRSLMYMYVHIYIHYVYFILYIDIIVY
jgi:hypothetical protein